ncbi:Restriction endonuclease [Streptomyces sp. ADI96-02]|uniref:restriction endonuclease n=1 Tax=Streptomyces sp. ADI96-02 TaxID=1522760 RepID=UPI000F554C74|nr:restriction endonuclease [Streptomyces sp. ADI96-02]RPK55486.1 Restriction endonuclease [Streptomyces sp. ADI96-02]
MPTRRRPPRRHPVRRSARRPSRRPAPRRRTAFRARPRGRQQERVIQAVVLVAVALWVAGRLLAWVAANPWIVLVVLAAAAAGGVLWCRYRAARIRGRQEELRALRYPVEQLDRLHHRQFEYAVRDLMVRDGCADAIQVGGAGDNGADVTATDPYGRRWVLQCKHRAAGLAGSAVGTPDLQVLNGTARQVHGADVAVIVTNGRVTNPAVTFAEQQRLHIVDRRTLALWASGSRPLWELLRAVPPPRKPQTLS